MKRKSTLGVLFFLVTITSTSFLPYLANQQRRTHFMVKMRDGVELFTAVYYPDGVGIDDSRAVVLLRTPYDIQNPMYSGIVNQYVHQDGYILVMQDLRGTHGSRYDDDFKIFFSDANDGNDTVNWILNQEWCNGSIATVGASAEAANQITYHAEGANVKAAFIHAGPSELYDHWIFPGGCLRKNFIEAWLPREGYAKFGEVVENARKDDDFWGQVSLETNNRFENVRVRAVHFGGWYDCFQQGTIDSFMLYNYNGSTYARDHQILVMGPWHHGGSVHPGVNYSSVETGMNEAIAAREFIFQESLDGIEKNWTNVPRVYYVVLGDPNSADPKVNQWRNATGWPVSGITDEAWYFHPNGTLSSAVPSSSANMSYLFDPSDPVKNGGGTTFPVQSPIESTPIFPGAVDNKPMEDGRSDILKFTSEILSSPVEIIGRITATLRVMSNCTDTDFTVKLLDIYPDGREINIADGILKTRYRNGFDSASEEFMTPGAYYDITVDLWSMAYRFTPGHRIRVSISSSNYPKFAVNDNTGGAITQFLGNSYFIANNTVEVGAGVAMSCIHLPRTE
ncbi:MAG: CocE/NonD family hydrolase [Promethearchaeota archaeon]